MPTGGVLATKVCAPVRPGPNGRGLSRKAILSEVDKSLKRLCTDYIDLYQIHLFDKETPLEETLSALNDVVRAGKVRYLGACNLHAWQLMKAIGLQRANGWPTFISIQNLYNLLNREEEREMLPLCLPEGVGAIPWSPLARGRLTRPWSDEPTTERAKTDAFARGLFERTAAIDKPVIDRLTEVARSANCRLRRSRSRGCFAIRQLPPRSWVRPRLLILTTLSPPFPSSFQAEKSTASKTISASSAAASAHLTPSP